MWVLILLVSVVVIRIMWRNGCFHTNCEVRICHTMIFCPFQRGQWTSWSVPASGAWKRVPFRMLAMLFCESSTLRKVSPRVSKSELTKKRGVYTLSSDKMLTLKLWEDLSFVERRCISNYQNDMAHFEQLSVLKINFHKNEFSALGRPGLSEWNMNKSLAAAKVCFRFDT